jgi:pimeloyl-ACP methyl ester carboxylesterase
VKKLFSETSLRDKPEIVSEIEKIILKTPADTICNTLVALAGRMETCSALPNINVPTLIFVGAEDKVTTPEAAQKLQELIPNSALRVLEKAGHLSNLEAADSFNLHLQSFLKSEFVKQK